MNEHFGESMIIVRSIILFETLVILAQKQSPMTYPLIIEKNRRAI